MSDQLRIPVSSERIAEFCRRFGVRELAVFGSVIREDFRPDSDVDVLLEFEPNHGFTFENTPLIVDDLRAIFGRNVDVVEKGRIRNPFRRASILSSYRVLYAEVATVHVLALIPQVRALLPEPPS